MRTAKPLPVSLVPSSRNNPLPAASLLAAVLVLGATGCGAAAQPGNFPTRDELFKLASGPAPQRVFNRGAVDADSFELTAPLPDSADGSEVEAETPWQKLLRGAVASRPGLVVASRATDCAARQVAAFVAAKNALPAEPLVRFIAGRCGVPSDTLAMAYRTIEVPESTPESELYDKWSAGMKTDIGEMLGAGSRSAGIAFARSGKLAAVTIVSARRTVHLEKLPLVPVDGKVVLKGELLTPAESIRALVTRGRFGFEVCIKDIEVNLPRFTIECPVSAEDPSAQIEVAAFPAGRELGEHVVDLRVYPAGTLEQTYTRRPADEAEKAPEGGPALLAALLGQVNAVRKEAGMADVRASEAQNRTAAQLAPFYFAALNGNLDATVADKVALGLLAGWDVGGDVREGHFASRSTGQRSPAALVDSVIASPFGRETLLDPAVSVIAMGTVTGEDRLGTVFSTYSMFGTTVTADAAPSVLARLTKLRGKIKRAAPTPVPELDPALADTVARVQNGLSLDEALGNLTKKSAEAVPGSRVSAWVVTTPSVEKLELPSETLAKPSLRLGVGVARYKPEGAPWTKLAVFFVVVEEPVMNNTARGPAGSVL